ncbi:hypothetical protein L1987_01449 [Smallanthus sonchifolius]|uniref:Uncharacterized protein n=1 Tax=Smallanthus sonchifolius TaxID=185202 RepID=A0ACB9K530_9ASTR|nr:hypothetical protein L1987_01449 [Smallanthus sonchifolius]
MAASKLMMVVVVMAIASFRLPHTVAQPQRHVVGDTFGWNVPNDGPTTYTTWASRQTFNVNDTLFFNFTTGFHDVAEVTQAAYGPCTNADPISRETNGPATLTLTRPGNHYYICTFGTHCQIGQKLTINVVGGSTTPPPAGSTTPPSPPAPSSASTFTAVVPVTFLAAALALFY